MYFLFTYNFTIFLATNEIPGLISCCKSIIKREGFTGFTKGLDVLLIRDTFSYGLYFATFEVIRRELKRNYTENDLAIEMIGGGIAGSLAWLSIMPIDVVKSIIQANYEKNSSPLSILKSIRSNHGLKGCYRGLAPVLIRGFIVNAATFVAWKRSLDYLNGNYSNSVN